MENLGILKSAIIALVTMYLLLPGPSMAYDNWKTHPEINDLAFERFVRDWMPNDASLNGCSMDRNKVLSGPAWDQDMGNIVDWYIGVEMPNKDRTKSVKDWLKSGGFSADMPEIPKGVRHYYAPHAKDPYITDLKAEFDALNTVKAVCLGGTGAATAVAGPVAGLAVTGGCGVVYGGIKFVVYWYGASGDINAILQNGVLGISNVDWAFDPDNLYSFYKAKEYYKAALGLADLSAELQYSKAWRGVGETMHLISDLTVPAHTRNDGHGIVKDPYEKFAKWSDVMKYSDPVLFTYSSDLDYRRKAPGKDLKAFMKDVATWTSENFFSLDTITRFGKDTTDNDQPAFSSPNLELTYIEDNKTYYYKYISTTDGYGQSKAYKIPLALKSWTGLLWKDAKLELDTKVLAAQAAFLIPTAIEASSAVLDAFLPRFVAKIDDVSKDPADETQYIVKGSLEHIPSVDWPEKELEVRNGAWIKITKKDGTKDSVGVPYPKDGVTWTWTGKLEPGDVIVLEFDLGGYVISSKPYTIPSGKSGATGGCNADVSRLTKKTNDVYGWYQEYYVDDKGSRQGPSIDYYDNAHKIIKKNSCFLDDKSNGHWIEYYESGSKMSEGEFKDGIRTGRWITYYNSGAKEWEGDYNDFKTGRWIKHYESGAKEWEIDYKDGKETGHEILYYENGAKEWEGDNKDDQRTGHWFEYYENGAKKWEGDRDNWKAGRWIEYYESGAKKSEGDYKDDVKIGRWIEYYESGAKKSEGNYEQRSSSGCCDVKSGRWTEYYESGAKKSEGDYNGLKIGHWIEYYEGGAKYEEGDYKDGLQTGHWIEYYKSGAKKWEGDYRDNRKAGRWTEYDENGKITRQEDYVDGVCTEIK